MSSSNRDAHHAPTHLCVLSLNLQRADAPGLREETVRNIARLAEKFHADVVICCETRFVRRDDHHHRPTAASTLDELFPELVKARDPFAKIGFTAFHHGPTVASIETTARERLDAAAAAATDAPGIHLSEAQRTAMRKREARINAQQTRNARGGVSVLVRETPHTRARVTYRDDDGYAMRVEITFSAPDSAVGDHDGGEETRRTLRIHAIYGKNVNAEKTAQWRTLFHALEAANSENELPDMIIGDTNCVYDSSADRQLLRRVPSTSSSASSQDERVAHRSAEYYRRLIDEIGYLDSWREFNGKHARDFSWRGPLMMRAAPPQLPKKKRSGDKDIDEDSETDTDSDAATAAPAKSTPKQCTQAYSRIDNALVLPWLMPSISDEEIDTRISDHKPLMLCIARAKRAAMPDDDERSPGGGKKDEYAPAQTRMVVNGEALRKDLEKRAEYLGRVEAILAESGAASLSVDITDKTLGAAMNQLSAAISCALDDLKLREEKTVASAATRKPTQRKDVTKADHELQGWKTQQQRLYKAQRSMDEIVLGVYKRGYRSGGADSCETTRRIAALQYNDEEWRPTSVLPTAGDALAEFLRDDTKREQWYREVRTKIRMLGGKIAARIRQLELTEQRKYAESVMEMEKIDVHKWWRLHANPEKRIALLNNDRSQRSRLRTAAKPRTPSVSKSALQHTLNR